MKKALVGAGGFASEVLAHIGSIDEMVCFVENEYYTPGAFIEVNSIHCPIMPLSLFDPTEYELLIVIGNPIVRRKIVESLPNNTKYFSFVSPAATILGNVQIGEGSIVCAGCVLTTNIIIGKHSHINLNTTIGHDCSIGDYFTTAPGVHVSGTCQVGECVYIGTNTSVREKIHICDNVTIGLNTGIVKDITMPGTYVGTPGKKI